MNLQRKIAIAHVCCLVALALPFLTACGTDEPAQPSCYELDIDHPKVKKTAKPAAPKPAVKAPSATRKR